MNTEARRKASAAFHAKRTAEGYRKVTLWLHEDTRAELERLAKVYGSKDRAASMAIDHHSHEARKREARQAEKVKPPDTSRAKVTNPGRPKIPYGSRLKKK